MNLPGIEFLIDAQICPVQIHSRICGRLLEEDDASHSDVIEFPAALDIMCIRVRPCHI